LILLGGAQGFEPWTHHHSRQPCECIGAEQRNGVGRTERMASDHKPEFDKIFKNLQIPVSFKCQYFDTEREDKQRKKQYKDNALAQDRVMQKIAERLEAARKYDSVPEAVKAGNTDPDILLPAPVTKLWVGYVRYHRLWNCGWFFSWLQRQLMRTT